MATDWMLGTSKEYLGLAAITEAWLSIAGRLTTQSRVKAQHECKADYTWSKLRFYLSLNTYDDDMVVASEINSVDGNQSVTVGAGLTGEFADNVNSDAVSDGDLICWHLTEVSVAGGFNMHSLQCMLTNANTYSPQIAHDQLTLNTDTSIAIGGMYGTSTETNTKFISRVSGTIDKFRVYLTTAAASARDVFLRKNGADTTLTVTIGAGLSGAFTDYVNSVAIVSGDELNYRGTGVSGSVYTINYAVRFNSDYRFLINSGSSFGTLNNVTCYLAPEGNNYAFNTRTTEAYEQFRVPADMTVKNLFVRAYANTHDVDDVIRTRVNGANGNCSVTIGAGLTGTFEDLVNSDSLSADDLFCYQGVFANGTNQPYTNIIGISETQSAGPAPAVGGARGSVAGKLMAAGLI